MSVRDVDGNIYQTVRIGNQLWMAENLRTTRYCNGHEIPYAREDMAWKSEKIGMRCSYDNQDEHAEQYGQLYNWFAVEDMRGLCPVNWHVPSDLDWITLERALGLSMVDAKLDGFRGIHGKGMKSEFWDGTNQSGFAALPAGIRDRDGSFGNLGLLAFFWSCSPTKLGPWYRGLDKGGNSVLRFQGDRGCGLSVRCVQD